MNPICKILHGDKYWVIPNTEKDELSYEGLGILHRENGPAIEYDDGSKFWYINGKYHREDGPAIEWDDGDIWWYLNGTITIPTNKMMEKYIISNPNNISKKNKFPLEIQLLAISLKQDVIYNIKYPDPELKQLYPKQIALREIGSLR